MGNRQTKNYQLIYQYCSPQIKKYQGEVTGTVWYFRYDPTNEVTSIVMGRSELYKFLNKKIFLQFK